MTESGGQTSEKAEPLYLIMHIPKTGGTTINFHLKKQLKLHEELILLNPYGKQSRERQHLKLFKQCSLAERSKAKVISGHFVRLNSAKTVPNKEPRFIIFLRNPADRLISKYNWEQASLEVNRNRRTTGRQPRFEALKIDKAMAACLKSNESLPTTKAKKWWEKKGKNTVTRWVASRQVKNASGKDLEIAKGVLDRCWFVGITERMDQDLPKLFKKMSISQDFTRERTAGKDLRKFATLTQKARKKIEKRNKNDMELYRYAVKLNKKTLKNLTK